MVIFGFYYGYIIGVNYGYMLYTCALLWLYLDSIMVI